MNKTISITLETWAMLRHDGVPIILWRVGPNGRLHLAEPEEDS